MSLVTVTCCFYVFRGGKLLTWAITGILRVTQLLT